MERGLKGKIAAGVAASLLLAGCNAESVSQPNTPHGGIEAPPANPKEMPAELAEALASTKSLNKTDLAPSSPYYSTYRQFAQFKVGGNLVRLSVMGNVAELHPAGTKALNESMNGVLATMLANPSLQVPVANVRLGDENPQIQEAFGLNASLSARGKDSYLIFVPEDFKLTAGKPANSGEQVGKTIVNKPVGISIIKSPSIATTLAKACHSLVKIQAQTVATPLEGQSQRQANALAQKSICKLVGTAIASKIQGYSWAQYKAEQQAAAANNAPFAVDVANNVQIVELETYLDRKAYNNLDISGQYPRRIEPGQILLVDTAQEPALEILENED